MGTDNASDIDFDAVATELDIDLTGYRMPVTEEEMAELYGDKWKGWDHFFGTMKKVSDDSQTV